MRIFLDLCHAVIDEIKERMTPFLEESAYNSQSKRLQVHQNNVFLIRLDMLDAFMMYYHSMYEVCKPDFRKEVRRQFVSSGRAVTHVRRALNVLTHPPPLCLTAVLRLTGPHSHPRRPGSCLHRRHHGAFEVVQ